MSKPADHDRRLAEIAARKDRFDIPRSWWNERDWRVHMHEARKQALVSRPLDGMPVIVPSRLQISFNLFDTSATRERQRRLAANRVLEKYGIGR